MQHIMVLWGSLAWDWYRGLERTGQFSACCKKFLYLHAA